MVKLFHKKQVELDEVTKKYLEKLKSILEEDDKNFFYEMLRSEMEFSNREKELHKANFFKKSNTIKELITYWFGHCLNVLVPGAVFGGLYEGIILFFNKDGSPVEKIVLGVIAVILLISVLYIFIGKEDYKKREDRETWVRHSLNYNRLRLILFEFIDNIKEEEPDDQQITQFKKDIYKQLRNSIKDFQNNMTVKE